MQGNGFKIGIIIAFLLLTVWYLIPSFQNYFISKKLRTLEGEAREEYQEANFNKIKNVQEKSLKLGLDLLGGMHVALEVRVDALISELATDKDDTFQQVLDAAREKARSGNESIIDAFIEAFEARDPNARLSRYFRNDDANITRRSSNAEVAEYLRTEASDAVDRAIEIIRQRVDRFGVTEPSIQKQGTRRIIVELPGVDDAERVRRLLRGTARLEFRLMAEEQALAGSLQNMIAYYQEEGVAADTAAGVAAADTALAGAAVDTAGGAAADSASGALAAAGADTSFDVGSLLDEQEKAGTGNKLLDVMQPIGQSVQFGQVLAKDTAAVNRLLADPSVREMLPPNVVLMYTAQPVGTTEQGEEVFYLLGVRSEVELTGEVITDAKVDFDEVNRPEVTMVMNAEGARTWARITGANINKPIAIVLDGVVYSYPRVINRIVGGRSSITNLDSRNEAQDVVTILKSGALPAPVDIAEERTVGPSLGAASIQAGFISVLVGLVVVALFMILYYRTAGLIADLALILNLIFILGILAGFNATLTLPGIAGIVLTIGMAVDANVLIFERVREEQSTGKTLKAAIDGGYSKALSAIFDANVTTFFVGAILYSFGVGPIQGFAVTLMAGIIASMFSAIVITRVIFDYMVVGRRMSVSYG